VYCVGVWILVELSNIVDACTCCRCVCIVFSGISQSLLHSHFWCVDIQVVCMSIQSFLFGTHHNSKSWPPETTVPQNDPSIHIIPNERERTFSLPSIVDSICIIYPAVLSINFFFLSYHHVFVVVIVDIPYIYIYIPTATKQTRSFLLQSNRIESATNSFNNNKISAVVRFTFLVENWTTTTVLLLNVKEGRQQ